MSLKRVTRWASDVLATPIPQFAAVSTKTLEGSHSEVANVTSLWSHIDVHKSCEQYHVRSDAVHVSPDGSKLLSSVSFPTDAILQIIAIRDGATIVMHRRKTEDEKKTDYIEVWSGAAAAVVKSYNVTESEKHGLIHSSSNRNAFLGFGDLQVHESTNKLLYVAEKKRPNASTFFETRKEEDAFANKYQKVDNFGEQLSDFSSTVICVLDLNSGEVEAHDFDSEMAFGDPYWMNETDFLAVAFETYPYRLGYRFCFNKVSRLVKCSLGKKGFEILPTVTPKHIRCPKVSPDGSWAMIVANEPHGPHHQARDILRYNFASKSVEMLSTHHFIESLPSNPWLDQSGNSFWMTVNQKDLTHPLVFSLHDGQLQERILSAPDCSSKGLATVGASFVVSLSSFSTTPRIELRNFTDRKCALSISNEHELKTEVCTPDWLEGSGSCMLVGPSSQDKLRPVLLCLHGGPHAVQTNSFSPLIAFFAKLGLNIVIVNYRGSSGFTKESLHSLGGKVGSLDVKDCYDCLQHALKVPGWSSDERKVAVTGGSHGGFLSLHLIGQYPETFKACVVRNPVTNIGTMMSTTDIPDWCVYGVLDSPYDFKQISTPQFYNEAYRMSPISHVDSVKTPTQFHIGQCDLRVPPGQGREYHRALLGRGVETELFEYPKDSHGLASPEASGNFLVSGYQWISRHLKLPDVE